MSILRDDELLDIYLKAESKDDDWAGIRAIAKAQHEQTKKAVKILALQAIADEEEFPSDMPDELWREIDGNREMTTRAMRGAARLTKKGITKRFKKRLKGGS